MSRGIRAKPRTGRWVFPGAVLEWAGPGQGVTMVIGKARVPMASALGPYQTWDAANDAVEAFAAQLVLLDSPLHNRTGEGL